MTGIIPNSLGVSLLGGVTGGIAGTGVSYGPVFMCVACGKKWSSSAPAKCSCGALVVDSNTNAALFYEKVNKSEILKDYYGTQFIKNLKSKMKTYPENSTETESEDFVDTSNDQQKFLQRVGVMSNLNVSVQGRRTGFSMVYRLLCDRCKQFLMVDASVVVNTKHEDASLVSFCTAHRHIVASHTTDGYRKFKDV